MMTGTRGIKSMSSCSLLKLHYVGDNDLSIIIIIIIPARYLGEDRGNESGAMIGQTLLLLLLFGRLMLDAAASCC